VHKGISALRSCSTTCRVARFPGSRDGFFNLGRIGYVVLSNKFSIAWVNYVCDHIAGGRLSGNPKWVNSAHILIRYAYICLATNCGLGNFSIS
jgi:hypothetical protein